MPYGASDTPNGTGGLPAHARSVFRAAANASYAKYGDKDEGQAHAIAWGAVKNAGYHKGKGGKWIAGDGMVMDEAIKRAIRMRASLMRDYDEDEPRDEGGKWSAGGGSGSRTSKLLAAAQELKEASGSKVALPRMREVESQDPTESRMVIKSGAPEVTFTGAAGGGIVVKPGGGAARAGKSSLAGAFGKIGYAPVDSRMRSKATATHVFKTEGEHDLRKLDKSLKVSGFEPSATTGRTWTKGRDKVYAELDGHLYHHVRSGAATSGKVASRATERARANAATIKFLRRRTGPDAQARAIIRAAGLKVDSSPDKSLKAAGFEPSISLRGDLLEALRPGTDLDSSHNMDNANTAYPKGSIARHGDQPVKIVSHRQTKDGWVLSRVEGHDGEKFSIKTEYLDLPKKGDLEMFGGGMVDDVLPIKDPVSPDSGIDIASLVAKLAEPEKTSPSADIIAADVETVIDRRRKTKEYDPEGREKATFEEEDFDDAIPTPLVSMPMICVCDAAGGSDMMYDAINLDDDAKVRYTDDGFMVATPRVARVGIQIYRGSECNKADMDTVRIYRPSEEVFSSDAMRSMTHRPMTLDHPTKPVTAGNWREHAVGQTGDEVLRDGNAIRVPMVLMDAAAISAFKDGKNQLSVGYDCDLDWTPGVTDGGEYYDAVQRNIKANHVAIVAAARGGPTLKIGDGIHHETSTKENTMNLKTLLVDGFQCQMEDTSATIVQRTITSMQDQIENFKKKLKAKEDDDDDAKEESEAKDAAIVKLDGAIKAKDAEIVVLKKQVTDAQAELTSDKLDARVIDRLSVISKAKSFLGDKWTAGNKSTETIRREVVASNIGDEAAKKMDDSHIESVLLGMKPPTFSQNKDSQRTPIDDAVLAFGRPGNGYTTVADAKAAAYTAYDEDLRNAWRGENNKVAH